MICRKCGKKNRGSGKFCRQCGAELLAASLEIKKEIPAQKINWAGKISLAIIALVLLFGGYKFYIYYQVQSEISYAKKLQSTGDFNGSISALNNLGNYSPTTGQKNIINAITADGQKFLTDKASFDYAVSLESSSSSADLKTALTDLQSIDASYPEYKDVQAEIIKVQDLLVTALQGDVNTSQNAAHAAEKNAQNAQSQAASVTQQLGKTFNLEELLTIGPALQSYYENLRNGMGIISQWWLGDYQTAAEFAANLAKHDLGENEWPQYESAYHAATCNSGKLGSCSYSYFDAEQTLLNVVYDPYAAGVSTNSNNSDSDSEKIQKILAFMNHHLTYEQSMNGILRAPVETLGFRKGECGDWSILASALFADAGIDSAVMLVKSKDGTEAHAMVLVQSNEDLPLSESYSDLTQFGLPSGKWWVIEPQYTLEQQQQNPGWFAKWNIIAAAEVPAVKHNWYNGTDH